VDPTSPDRFSAREFVRAGADPVDHPADGRAINEGEIMGVSTRRWRALAAVAAVGVSVAVFNSSVSPVAGDGPVSQVNDVGVLRLRLAGSGGTITFTPDGAAQPTVTQSITVTAKCGAASVGTLATVSSTGGSQGLGVVTNGLGVRQKNTCSSAEGRVSGNERVSVALGSGFPSDVFVVDAELDIEGKFNASLDVSLDSKPVINRALHSSSDNGPDSGISDNDRVLLSETQADVEPFRAMTLGAHGGEFSLEGGGDASYAEYASSGKVGPIGATLGTADSIFQLATVHDFADDLFCGETLNAALIGGSATSAAVTRLDNDDDQECEDVGVTMEILDNGVRLDKGTIGINSGTPQFVNATVTIEWAPQPANVPLIVRQINFFDTDNQADFEDVQWCDSWDPTDPTDPTAIHPTDARFPGGVLPWCLVEEHAVLGEDGTVVQVQTYHGSGDPRWQ
jgi:hypothetical protein